MLTDIGEYIVGAYLQLKLDCDVVDYNARPPGGGLQGLDELDVIGLNLKTKTAYLCEVTTHIRGLQYGDRNTTIERIKKKYRRQQQYGAKYLSEFSRQHMLWSPVVPTGFLTDRLPEIAGLQCIINGEYKRRVGELQVLAAETTHDARNPVFRLLQILAHLRD
ncbi:hypothetical protein [Burkholderia gladioli]|uniref:hypothetical protein n=1 Tax=Burkholderia gladioli TaxID=28095 RepID=UPI00163F8E64|nr:hypothetical protein [Burkholderia gladioli]